MDDEKQYTEDDLFRVLARPSFEEIRELHRKWAPTGTSGPTGSMANIPFMKHYGWTWFEYMQECQRQHMQRLIDRKI